MFKYGNKQFTKIPEAFSCLYELRMLRIPADVKNSENTKLMETEYS